MTNNPSDAREAALKEAIDVYNFGATHNAKNFRDPVAFRAAINHAIDAFIKASSTEDGGEAEIRERSNLRADYFNALTNPRPDPAHEDRETLLSTTDALRSQNAELKLELAKEREKFTMHTAHVGAWLSAAAQELGLGGAGDNLDVATVLTQVMDQVKAANVFLSRVGELEKDNAKLTLHINNVLEASIGGVGRIMDLQEELDRTYIAQGRAEADRDQMRKALQKILRTPSMPFPDIGAHSLKAFSDAVWRAWCEIQRIAHAALAEGSKP